MTVYTVNSTDDIRSDPPLTLVAGSYTTRGKALDECVAYIMKCIEHRQDLARVMLDDKNHPEAGKFFVEHKDGTVGVRKGCISKLKKFIRDELGGTGCYYVYDGIDRSWHFDVNENDAEGELWTTVTWGDSDCEDPGFTTPWPETFTSKDEAIKAFVNYAKNLMAGQEMGVPDNFYAIVEQQLDEDGKCQVDLDDGSCISCVLYHSDAKNMKGQPKWNRRKN
jgi:hypothetical protein